MKNQYFSYGSRSEQRLYDNLTIEAIQIHGLNCYYIPRKLVNYDELFGEDVDSKFDEAYIIEMYLESYQQFQGQGDLFTKFGVQINDQALFTISKTRWEEVVSSSENLITSKRPNEGDLIYYPLGKKLFQINFVEHESPFWQLGDIQAYKMNCELFVYTQEEFDTEIDHLQDFENKYAFSIELKIENLNGEFEIGETILSKNLKAIVKYADDSKIIIHSSNENPVVNSGIIGTRSSAYATILSFSSIDEKNQPNESDNLFFENENSKNWEYEEKNAFGEFQLGDNF